MSTTFTPNMNLTLPTVGSEPGPDYALEYNNNMSSLDQHDHSAGSGVKITPNGININAALAMNNNFLTSIAGLTLQAQSSAPAVKTVYVSGTDLYYVDGIGNNVRITQSGGVAGSPGSISNLVSPASASYVAGSSTFVWQSNTSIAANMDFGAAIMRNLTPNSTFALTLQPPAALSSNYTITLPALPSSQKIMTLDNTGNMAAPYAVDNSTIQIVANIIKVGDGSINALQLANGSVTTAKIADNNITTVKIVDGNITKPKLAPLGQQTSVTSSGAFTTTSTVIIPVTNVGLTITTTGRPVRIELISDGSGNYAHAGGTGNGAVFFQINRGATAIANMDYTIGATTVTPPGAISFIDDVGAGTYVYTLNTAVSGPVTSQVFYCKLIAYEL